jgi:aldose 1-epimerase
MAAPSGTQYEIRRGEQRAVVVEVGGGLREYTVADRAVLDGYSVDVMADGARGQPLLPWPNRIADGRYLFDGQDLQLPINEVARNCAIHGLTRWSNWTAAAQDKSGVTMELTLHPQPGYPFTLELSLTYTLEQDGLRVGLSAVNRGDNPAPFGAGFHPYFASAQASIDGEMLRVPSTDYLDLDARGIPNGRIVDASGGPLDFSSAKPIGDIRLDTCFTNLARNGGGEAEVRFGNTTLWLDGSYTELMVFTGDTLDPERRRQGLALEPMTCAPNAFQVGEHVAVLRAREEFTAAWGIRPG